MGTKTVIIWLVKKELTGILSLFIPEPYSGAFFWCFIKKKLNNMAVGGYLLYLAEKNWSIWIVCWLISQYRQIGLNPRLDFWLLFMIDLQKVKNVRSHFLTIVNSSKHPPHTHTFSCVNINPIIGWFVGWSFSYGSPTLFGEEIIMV